MEPPPLPEGPVLTPHLVVDAEGIADLVFQDPDRPLNILAAEVMHRLDACIGEVEAGARQGRIRALRIRSGKAAGFIAGADVEEIAAIAPGEEALAAIRTGQQIFGRVAALPVPTLAVLHGACLGGGLELALACRYRAASDGPDTRIGLPEVQLGILPAWGGTTRLPRKVGLTASLDLLLTGRTIDGRRALRMGLVDVLLPASSLEPLSRRFLLDRLAGQPLPPSRRPPLSIRLLEGTGVGRRLVLSRARTRVLAQTRGHYPAPLEILSVLRRSTGRPVSGALEIEAEGGARLIGSEVSRNLIRVFRLRESARKGWKALPGEESRRPITQIGVLGAGVMGGGIAALFSAHRREVRIRDVRHEAIGQALRHARDLVARSVSKGARSRLAGDRQLQRISGGITLDGFQRADLIVEAVVERLDVKRAVLAEVEQRVRPGTILTSNTSTLPIDALADALEHPESLVGMHFFNPVDRMPLIEVIQGARSSEGAVRAVAGLAVECGKVPVVVRDGAGFLVNRILSPYLNEAGFLLGEGVGVPEVDAVALDFGMPMGPFRLLDEVGFDVACHAGQVLHQAFGRRMAPSPLMEALARGPRLGRKGGSGFYRYENGGERGPDPSMLPSLAPLGQGPASGILPSEIRDRLFLAMVNEAARILEEGIVKRAADVDLGMILGTGFPPFRGGLLAWADARGIPEVRDRLLALAARAGDRFTPAPLVVELARSGAGFHDRFPG